MKQITAFLQITRPLNVIQSWIAILITASLFPDFPSPTKIILTAIVVSLYLAAGNAINDFFDFDIDMSNRPNRPLSRGAISPTQALIFSFILFGLGTIAFFPIVSKISAIILVINMLLLIIYTPILKPTILLGNLAVSYLLGSAFIFGAEIFGNISKGIVPCTLAFMFNFARELIKDIEDKKGDQQQGLKTFPVAYGTKISKIISSIIILLIIVTCILPYSFSLYGKFYLLSVILTVEIPLFLVLYLLANSEEKRDFARVSIIMKILVFFGLLSIYLGKF